MIQYLLKRLIMMVPLLLGITLITFAVIHLAPGEPVEMQIAMNKQNLQDLKDKGMIVTVVNKADFAERTKDTWRQFEPDFGKGFYEKVVEAAK